MDLITNQFVRKTPALLLDKYKHHVRRLNDLTMKTPVNMMFGLPPQSNEQVTITGSAAEGASLARLFSPDSNTSREVECDVMCNFWLFKVEEDLLHYVENNKVFAHIKVDLSLWSQVVSIQREDDTQSMLSGKEDGLYLNSSYNMCHIKERLEQMPTLLNNLEFRTCEAEKKCEVGSASIKLLFTNPEDKPPETEICRRADAQHFKLTQEIKQHHKRFDANIAEMLNRLQILEKEFVEMRSGKVPASLHDHEAKALEWTMICIDAIDVTFDFRQNAMCIGIYTSQWDYRQANPDTVHCCSR